MTKAIIKTFNETENAMDLTFAKNAAKVYAPFFKAVKDREIAFEMFKGEKGATEAKLQYDIEHGFRNSNKDYLVGKSGLSNSARLSIISQAKFFADYSVKELQNVSGATLGTAYKNVSIAKNASNPKRGKVSNAKPANGDKPVSVKNGQPLTQDQISAMAKEIVKSIGEKNAKKLSIAIYDLVVGADDEKVGY